MTNPLSHASRPTCTDRYHHLIMVANPFAKRIIPALPPSFIDRVMFPTDLSSKHVVVADDTSETTTYKERHQLYLFQQGKINEDYPIKAIQKNEKSPKTNLIGGDVADELESIYRTPRDKGQRLTNDVVELIRDPSSPLTAQGTYFVKDRATGHKMGVFKPSAEEALMQSRRKMSISCVIKRGIVVGDAAIKEKAAFLLDFDGFAGVPRTDFAVIDDSNAVEHFGSLQEFCEHMCTSEDLGPSKYDLENVHAIALLDLRLFNLDRHEGNLLVRVGAEPDTYRLVPIDHGFSLPSFRTLSDAMFCWTAWRQAKMPLSPSTREYLCRIKPVNDIVALKRIGLRDESTMTYVLCSRYVQQCAEAGMTLYGMASSMQRDLNDNESMSTFETIVQRSSTESNFNDFVFDDRQNSWTCDAVQRFLETFDRNVQLTCRN
uniref:PI3K/PI4K catalytic domain-containing protein n=1 Tax=Spongospora subterranea TaxID=70186 RepID=A0A0H5RDG5_9EUKA|eukprot:CRZ11632.1 hypothetical protein [Spongospora subterranea]